jgi:MraZ protein
VALFLGQFENKIDKKGRVSVPAPFRSILGAPDNSVVFYKPPGGLRTLEGGGTDRLEKIQDRLDQLREYTPEYQRLQLIFADSALLTFDPEGRIMLPARLIDHAEIDDTVIFAGTGRTFQLWSPPNYTLYRQRLDAAEGEALSLPPLSPPAAGGFV